MTLIEACIFDLDGVLVDTARYHYASWKKLATEWDIELTVQENEKLKGVSRVDSLKHILALGGVSLSQAEIDRYCHIKNDHYLTLIADMNESELLPNVKSILDDLVAHDIKIGLGSASKNAPLIIKKTGIEQYFGAVVSGNDVTHSKPDPEVFLKGAEGLGVTPNATIVFEDSQKGIEAAKRGGFLSVGIGHIDDLGDADIVIPGFAGITIQEIFQLLTAKMKNS